MIFIIAASGFCVDWRTTNQATVAWDAVNTLSDGSALPAGDIVKYRVYLANAITDPNKANPALIDETDLLQFTLTLNAEGRYLIGVQAVRYDSALAELGTSEINWSDVNGAATPNPFGIVHYFNPAIPMNLR